MFSKINADYTTSKSSCILDSSRIWRSCSMIVYGSEVGFPDPESDSCQKYLIQKITCS